MSTFLPLDTHDHPMPALRLKNGAAHSLTASVTSVRNTSGFSGTTRIISVYAEQPVYLRFGGSSVTASASDHYFPAGVYYDFAIGGDQVAHYTHLAVLAVDAGGAVYISEKE